MSNLEEQERQPDPQMMEMLPPQKLPEESHAADGSDTTSESEELIDLKLRWSILGVCLVALGAALTAALPVNEPHHQHYAEASTLVGGDTAYMIVSTIMGLFVGPALVHFYSVVYRVHGDHDMQLYLLAGSLVTFLWVLFTFSLCYGSEFGDSDVSIPGNVTDVSSENFYMFKNTYGNAGKATYTIPNSIFSMHELCFALLPIAIITSSLVGRLSTIGFLVFIFFWHILVYCPTCRIMWGPDAVFDDYYIQDFAGGLVVNVLAAITAARLHTYLEIEKTRPVIGVHDANKVLEAFFLVWILWFGLCSGKAHAASPVAAQVIVNIFGCTAAAVMISFFVDLILERNTTLVSVTMAMMVALVAITPACGSVTVGGAMCIGIGSFCMTLYIANTYYAEGLLVNEPFSVLTLHGVAGSIGYFATSLLSYKFINPDARDGATWGNFWPPVYQLVSIVLYAICSTVTITALIYISDWLYPIGVPTEDEKEYPGFMPEGYDADALALAAETGQDIQLTLENGAAIGGGPSRGASMMSVGTRDAGTSKQLSGLRISSMSSFRTMSKSNSARLGGTSAVASNGALLELTQESSKGPGGGSTRFSH